MKINSFFKWVLFTIFFEILAFLTVGFFIYSNYEKITKEKSVMEKNTQIKTKLDFKADINNYKVKSDTNKSVYSWYFGKVMIWNIQTWENFFNLKIREVKDIKLDYDKLTYVFMLNNLLETKKIDIYIYNYFKNKWNDKFMKFYQNNEIFAKYINGFNLEVNKDYVKQEISKIEKLINDNKYIELIAYLKGLESKINDYSKDANYKKIAFKPTFFDDKDFNYIISKLYWEGSVYKKYIDESSKMFWFNKNLLIWSIASEQMRWFYTERWQLKWILQNANLLVINNKFSFGIWWIKINTAQKIENDLNSYNSVLYKKIFWTDTKDVHTRLTQTDDFQIYYASALVYNILTRRKLAWIDISDEPWVVVTLYNFWNLDKKEPHDNPGIGGAVLDINGVNYSFGWLWMMIYYILEFYY